MKTKISFSEKLPWSPEWSTAGLLIFDRRLLQNPAAAKWIKKFPHRYGVIAGEDLKDARAFPKHLEFISREAGELPNRSLTIVVAGGGSVGDFGGFVASIFKRGVKLVNVPTTWLAALDSAHGGKNGLNVLGVKNQIGTIYPAAETHIAAEVLRGQPSARALDAGGEVLKMAFLKGGALARLSWSPEESFEGLWKALPLVVRGKMSIVEQDPQEKSGVRHLLNLGHTMGHVFEAALKLPHGIAVVYGLAFAATFSRAKGICSAQAHSRIVDHPLWDLYLPLEHYQKGLSVSESRLKQLLLQDKKRTRNSSLRFVFLKDIGKPVIREVGVDEILKEIRRQKDLLRGWA